MKRMIYKERIAHTIYKCLLLLGILIGPATIFPVFAQPANNVCSGAEAITPDGTCTAGTTIDATDNWIGTVGCQASNNVGEVWYSFTADSSSIIINLTAGSIGGDLEFILIEAATGCTGNLFLNGSSCGASVLQDTLSGLTVGVDYLFTVNSTGSDGTFTVCITSYTGATLPGQDCGTAVPVCDTTSFGVGNIADGVGLVSGNSSEEDLSALTCFGGDERQSQWYTFTCRTTGTIEFSINPNVNGDDYDWALFDNTSANCLLNTNSAPVIACNWSGCAGATGLSSSPSTEPGVNTCGGPADACSGGNYERAFCNTATGNSTPPTITAGQTYVLIIDNFSVSNSGFNFTWGGATGGMTAEIGVLAAFTASTSCSNNDVDVTATVYPNNSTYTWTWGDASSTVGSATETHTYSSGGQYIVSLEVTDALGCTDITSLTVDVGAGPTLAMDSTMITCNGAGDGTATGIASAGLAPYTYLWNDSGTQTDSIATGLSAGTYTITVTDNNGCTYADSVIITEPAALVADAGSAVTICTAESTVIGGAPTASGGVSPFTYAWDQASSLDDSTLANPTASPTSNTTYTVSIIDASGCTDNDAVIITVDPLATANANADVTICEGSTYILSGAIGGSASSSTWTGGDGTFDDATLLAATYTPGATDISSGTVTLTITTDDPAGSCTAAADSMVLTINAAATANANSGATICEGATYTLSGAIGGSATSSAWSTSGDGSFDNTALLAATYTPGATDISTESVTLTITTNDPAGPCPAALDSMIVTINQEATVSADIDATICEGTTYTLSGSIGGSAASSTWSSGGDGTFDNAALLGAIYTPGTTDISTGNVTLTITTDDPAGPCPSVVDSMILTINAAATANANSDTTICEGAAYILSGIIGGSATSSSWTTSGDGTFDDAALLAATYTPGTTDISTGTVTLTITTNDPAGSCPSVLDTMTLTVTTKDDPSFNYSSGTFCQTGGNPTPVITGTPGGLFSSTPAGLIFVSTATGEINLGASVLASYTIQYTTNGTCPDSSTVGASITNSTNASFFYNDTLSPDTAFCQDGANPLPAYVLGASAGTYSALPGGLVFVNTSTGEVDLGASTPGTYTVENYIAASGGCGADSSYHTVIVELMANVSAGTNATICEGSTHLLGGSIADSATSSTWSSGGDGTFDNNALLNATYTPGAADISAGTVVLTITSNDPVGVCQAAQDSITLSINTPTTASAGSNDTICEGSTYLLSGAFGGSATGSVWSTSGDGSFDNTAILTATYTPGATDISSGSVTLTITTDDPTGPCPAAADSMVLIINAVATVNAGSDATVCEATDHILSGSIGGPASNSTWSTGGDGSFDNTALLTATYTPGATDISSGSVTLTLTTDDPAGPCPLVMDSLVLTINQATTATAGLNDTICEGNSYALSGAFGGSATSSSWTTLGDGTFDNTALPAATYTPGVSDISTGNVILIITTDDPAGPCAATVDSMALTINSSVTVGAGTDATICEGSDHLLSGSIGGGASSSTWSTTGDGTFDNTALLAATYSPGSTDISTGTVTLILTTDDPSGPCPALSDSMALTVNPTPVTSLSSIDASCGLSNGEATVTPISGTAPFTYLWDINTGNQTDSTAIGLSAGSFGVTVTGAGGCISIDTVVIASASALVLTTTFMDASCANDGYAAVQVTGGNAPYTYLWNDPSSQTTDTASSLSPGLYTVVVADSSSCIAIANVTIGNIGGAFITVDSTSNLLCGGDSTGSISITVTGGIAPLTYLWSNADTTEDITGVTSGAYNVTVSDASGCIAIDSANVTGPPPLVLSTTTMGASCGGTDGYATVSVSGGGGPFTYLWDDLSSQTTDTAMALGTGAYTVVVTDMNSCSESATAIIGALGGPSIIMDSAIDVVCNGDANGSIDVTVSGGTAPLTYLWSNTDTTEDISGLSAGVYSIVVTDAGGCLTSDSAVISEPNAILVTASGTYSCIGEATATATATASGGTGTLNYLWDDGNAQTTSISTGLSSGLYTVTVTDSSGCTQTDTTTVGSLALPTISAGTDVTIALGGSVSLSASGGLFYSWTPSTGLSCTSCQSTVSAPTSTTQYVVTGTDVNGCSNSDSVSVIVDDKIALYVPDIFSPNGDGENDKLFVQGLGIESVEEFIIYDRWGEKVFENANFDANDPAEGWDGIYKGSLMNPAVFVFYVKVIFVDDSEQEEQGDITLVH